MTKPNTMDDLDEILERDNSIRVRRKQLHSIVPIEANALDSSKAIEAKLKEEFGEPLYLKQALTAKLEEVDRAARIDELNLMNNVLDNHFTGQVRKEQQMRRHITIRFKTLTGGEVGDGQI